MRKSGAQRQREYRERLKARQEAASGTPTTPQNAPQAASGIVKRPLAEAGTCGLFLDGLEVTLADGCHAYTAALTPQEALGLGLRLLKSCGVSVELTGLGEDRPRPLPASTPISLIRPQGHA